jgi:hypothetical protein
MQNISTDTATICIYDLECLKHRISDTADWWSLPWEEVSEVNNGNILFLDVGDDGTYDFEVSQIPFDTDHRYFLRNASGKFFIGPGEEVTGGHFEPTGKYGGFFVDVRPGLYEVYISRTSYHVVAHFQSVKSGSNKIDEPINLR